MILCDSGHHEEMPTGQRKFWATLAGILTLLSLATVAGSAKAAVQARSVPFVLISGDEQTDNITVPVPTFPSDWGQLVEARVIIAGTITVSGVTPLNQDAYSYSVFVTQNFGILASPGQLAVQHEKDGPVQHEFDIRGSATGQGEPFDHSIAFTMQAAFNATTDILGGDASPTISNEQDFITLPSFVQGTRAGFTSDSTSYASFWVQEFTFFPDVPLVFPEMTVTTAGTLTVEYEFVPNFGTEVGFDTGVPGPVDGIPAPLNGVPKRGQIADDARGEREARAEVSPGLLPPQDAVKKFDLQIFARDFGSAGDTHSPQAFARAAARYTVEGLSEGSFVAASVKLEGTFDVSGGVPGPHGTVDLNLTVYAERDRRPVLALFSVTSGAQGLSWTQTTCGPSIDCSTSHTTRGSFWSGSHTLDFHLPVQADGVVDVVLWALADAFAGRDTTVDFPGSAKLEILPPPGVVVRLGSGQVFVPEPSGSLFVIMASGLLIFRRWCLRCQVSGGSTA